MRNLRSFAFWIGAVAVAAGIFPIVSGRGDEGPLQGRTDVARAYSDVHRIASDNQCNSFKR
jgi:hypothetical protein